MALNVVIFASFATSVLVFAFSESERTKTTASLAGSLIVGAIALITAIFFVLYGSLLVRSLSKDFKSTTRLLYHPFKYSTALLHAPPRLAALARFALLSLLLLRPPRQEAVRHGHALLGLFSGILFAHP